MLEKDHLQLGIDDYNSGDYYNAIKNFTKYIELGVDEEAYLYRGMCYKHLKKYDDAINDYTNCLDLYYTY